MRFSERYGFKPAQDTIQLNSISMELRNSLWSVLTEQVWRQVYYSSVHGGTFLSPDQNPEMTQFCRRLWFEYFKKPLDTLPGDWRPVHDFLRKYFFSCVWYEVYDFIDFVSQHYPYRNHKEFVTTSNYVLERELSGYRFVGGRISPITDKAEISEVDQALIASSDAVRTHLGRALELLADKHKPAYRNSIKESISAVESVVQEVLGEKGTLGQLVKKLEDEIQLHGALKSALSSLYGYTSDADGIRHALMDLPTLTFEEAKFFLVVCSAFVNFVRGRIKIPSNVP